MKEYLFALLALALLAGCPAKKTEVGSANAVAPLNQSKGQLAPQPVLVTTAFKVEGMDCADCSKAIEQKLIGIAGVSTVAADDKAGIAKVQYDPAKVTPEKIIAALDTIKFKATVQDAKAG